MGYKWDVNGYKKRHDSGIARSVTVVIMVGSTQTQLWSNALSSVTLTPTSVKLITSKLYWKSLGTSWK
jgi:hypothetical protein